MVEEMADTIIMYTPLATKLVLGAKILHVWDLLRPKFRVLPIGSLYLQVTSLSWRRLNEDSATTSSFPKDSLGPPGGPNRAVKEGGLTEIAELLRNWATALEYLHGLVLVLFT
jgi:hypothetical protein